MMLQITLPKTKENDADALDTRSYDNSDDDDSTDKDEDEDDGEAACDDDEGGQPLLRHTTPADHTNPDNNTKDDVDTANATEEDANDSDDNDDGRRTTDKSSSSPTTTHLNQQHYTSHFTPPLNSYTQNKQQPSPLRHSQPNVSIIMNRKLHTHTFDSTCTTIPQTTPYEPLNHNHNHKQAWVHTTHYT